MKAAFYKIFIFISIPFFILFVSTGGFAQTENVQPKFKQVFIRIPKIKVVKSPPKNYKPVIDSLTQIVHGLDSNFQAQLIQIKIKDSVIAQKNLLILKQQPVIIELNQQTSAYSALNAQLEKSNIILLVFNSAVCVFLFALLIPPMLKSRNKKKKIPVITNPPFQKDSPAPVTVQHQHNPPFNLSQFEKLAKLRRDGILTEKEFAIQKELVLKNSN